MTKDSQIRNLKEELTHQDELVEKLQVMMILLLLNDDVDGDDDAR